MIQELEKLRERREFAINFLKSEERAADHYAEFLSLATNLKILAAANIRVTNHSLEIIMQRQEHKQTKKPRPERKTF